LEFITNLILAKKIEGLERVVIDVGGFRKKRKEKLVSLARNIANKVSESGQPEVLLNLSPRERRVIHLELSQNPNVETRSEGEGETRKLIIQPKKKA